MLLKGQHNFFFNFQSSLKQASMSPQVILLHKGGSAISLQTEFPSIWKICLHSNCKKKKKKSTVITERNKNVVYEKFF